MDIQLQNLRHTYRTATLQARTVLDIDEWRLPAGAQVLLRGISGSGKTTLMNVIAGLLPPSAGQVWLDQQAIYDLPEAQRDRFRAAHIGYIFQIHLLVSNLSALENVEMPLVFARRDGARQRRTRATEMLAQVGLSDHLAHRPAQMSAGQRLRVAVARALVTQPKLLLADEPTAALDAEHAALVMDLVQTRCREQGTTLLAASHDPAMNHRFDQVLDLRSGRLTAATRPAATDPLTINAAAAQGVN